MPLRVELTPGERVLVGGAIIRNIGSLKVDFIVESQTKVLREKYLRNEQKSCSAPDRLFDGIQQIYLAGQTADTLKLVADLASEARMSAPDSAQLIEKIELCLHTGDVYQALKYAKDLVDEQTGQTT